MVSAGLILRKSTTTGFAGVASLRQVERAKFIPFRQAGEGVRSLEAGIGAACKNHTWQKQPRRVFSLRDALRCGRCLAKATSV
jgi:hypothetical protein